MDSGRLNAKEITANITWPADYSDVRWTFSFSSPKSFGSFLGLSNTELNAIINILVGCLVPHGGWRENRNCSSVGALYCLGKAQSVISDNRHLRSPTSKITNIRYIYQFCTSYLL